MEMMTTSEAPATPVEVAAGVAAGAAAAGGGSPAAGAVTTGAGEGGGGFFQRDGTLAEGWVAGLPAELGEAREAFGRFKSVGDLAKSYHGLQQLLGKKAGAVVVPSEKSTPEEVAAYRKALGVPEKAEGYALAPGELPGGVEWSAELAQPFFEIAHKHNVPAAAMQELIAAQGRLEAGRSEATAAQAQAELDRGETTLRATWGASYERNLGLASRAAKMAGVDPQARGFTDPEVVKGFTRLAAMLSEDHFVKGEEGALQGGPSRARDIMTNPKNALYRKYQDGESDTVDLVRGLLQRS